ncbi:hypothetical protein ACF0H5_017996 [Mactra antiquata]
MVVDCANGSKCPTLETYPEGMGPADIVAVFSSTENVLFKNSRCAECNGVYEYERWSLLAMECVSEIDDEDKVIGLNARIKNILSSCGLLSYPPSQDLQKYRCYEEINATSTCNVTGLWGGVDKSLEEACLDPFANIPVKRNSDTRHYRNIFCDLCNNPDSLDIDNLVCYSISKGTAGIFNSFDSILNISLDSETVSKSDINLEEYECDEHEIFDTVHQTCRHLHCMKHMLPYFGKCVEDPATEINKNSYFVVDIGLLPVDMKYSLTSDDMNFRTVTEELTLYQQNIFETIVAILDAPECNHFYGATDVMFVCPPSTPFITMIADGS